MVATTDVSKHDDESQRRERRRQLRNLNATAHLSNSAGALDSSLKRHTALIKRMRQSMGLENRDQLIRDIEGLALEKYLEEIVSASAEGCLRCKSEKDSWAAVEVISTLHRRFPGSYTPPLINSLSTSLAPTPRSQLASLSPEQREKEESARVTRQRPILRVCSELALVGLICDGPNRSGGEWVMKAIKDLISNDPTLSSLPLLSTFLKSYGRPFLGLTPSNATDQLPASTEPGELSAATQNHHAAKSVKEEEELVEKDIREKFKRMCDGYFETISRQLVKEHLRLQEQDRRNHEAYIRSGEIFEDRQQAYEKMTKSYEKLLSSCQVLSDLLSLPMPHLPTIAEQTSSIGVTDGSGSKPGDIDEITAVGKWEDEEERRFYEEIPDLKEFVPKSVLGLDGGTGDDHLPQNATSDDAESRKRQEADEIQRLESKMEELKVDTAADDEDDAPTPVPTPPRSQSPTTGAVGPGPSALLTNLLARLPDATNRALTDQAAVDFAFLNSKAARKRLVKFLGQVPKNRTDLLPHYSRLVASLNRYMPDVGTDLLAVLEEEFRYLQRKKNVVREFAEQRLKNVTFLSELTKFGVVPPHFILHVFKVYLDEFSGVNIDNTAMLLEKCGRYLMRTEETTEKMVFLVELMRRKQNAQHLDQRQVLALENAYYQCNPPERGPRQIKERPVMEQFIRHLMSDVLSKKTIDKVLKLLRKLDWDDAEVAIYIRKAFVKPWKLKYNNISLLAMLAYDLQRYHSEFVIGVVDQVFEDIRQGLEQNLFKYNQRRVSTVKYLGELYIYRLISSSHIFETLWLLMTFGHSDGRPNPEQPSPVDSPDDFFRVRLVCVLLDACGMCFDRGSLKRKLDDFLTFFQYYVFCKEELPMDISFMMSDTIEALRPKLVMFKDLDEAATAVDEMIALAKKNGPQIENGDDEGDDSGDEGGGDRSRDRPDDDDEDGEEDVGSHSSGEEQDDVAVVKLSESAVQGPSADEEADFAKDLAKMLSDTSDTRKLDKRSALSNVDPSSIIRRKRVADGDGDADGGHDEASPAQGPGLMSFTLISRRGNKQQARELGIPETSSLAVHTRTAQLQDKVEQQQLKKIVLDYEQREGVEEMRALEDTLRSRGMKVKHQHGP
ncbi:transcription factor [Clavulina sp. PMI_390]|nr:transcription factor [Clavulina sp. PMI_390]